MQDLRLVGVHEGGEHLLLAGENGEHFRLPLDEALRAAARRDRPRLGQLQIEMDGGMRPREVQSLIRAGATAEEVADRSGWSVEKVRKYEGPIVAERTHVADQARQVRVRTRGGSAAAPTLQGRVGQRMRERGVDAETTIWDAYRAPESRHWTVTLTFAAGGRQRQASWTYDPVLRTVEATDDEARWLSADEPAASGPVPAAPVRSASVYDVEAEGGVAATVRRPGSAEDRPDEPVDLMTAMRQRTTVGRRSGRRRSGSAEPARREREEATVLPLDSGEPEADPQLPVQDEPVELTPAGAEVPPLDEPALPLEPEPEEPHTDVEEPPEGSVTHADEADDPTDDTPTDKAPTDEAPTDATPTEEAPVDEAPPADEPPRPTSRRKPRTSVPSWDDIMFGTKRD